jgi:hypothetical protein
MFQANVYSIMIVSPSDVVQEREIVKQTIYEWNSIHSEKTGIILQPVGWDINSFPQMGNHPQDVINQQVLENSDIIVAIFWTRVGTRTNEYDSGSIEEITKHVESGKDALLYFNMLPVVEESIDKTQYETLLKYKRTIQSEGYYWEYDSVLTFSKLFYRHLSLLINSKYIDQEHKIVDLDRSFTTDIIGDKAKEILMELSQDKRGILGRFQYLSGFSVETNGKEFGSDSYDPRVIATIEEAIQQLEENGFINATNTKRELFQITAKGYKYCEK